MFQHHRRVFPKLVLIFSLFCLAAWARMGFACDIAPLPANQWNQENLAKIQSTAAEPLTFAVMGDSRDNPPVFGGVLKKVDNDPDLAFVIHLGDMVREAELEQYQTFFTVVRQNLHKPLLAVVGNHELNGDRDLEIFHQIFGPDYYAFQIGQNYFIVINDTAEEEGMSQAQFRWLEAELQKSQSCKTRMVFCHIPLDDPRDGDKPHSLKPEEAAKLSALFKRYKVTHVFAGHIHSYYAGDWKGMPYTITGGAGAPLAGTDPQHAFYHYVKVSLRGDQVMIQVAPLGEPAGK
jgi:predicted phosphodiesterase